MSPCYQQNAEITPMHCCLGEPDCLAGIMLLFKTNWHMTCRQGRGTGLLFQFLLFSMMETSWLCFCPHVISTSSHDESLAATMVSSQPLKNNIKFRILS